MVHLHWIDLQYGAPSLARSLRLLMRTLAGIGWAKAKGCAVVYTVHNLEPHERSFPWLDRAANHILFRWVDALHVHDEEARSRLIAAYGRQRGVYVIAHGSYIGAYPNQCTPQEARARLGLDQAAFVYLCLGQVRRYKGIEDLVAAFARLGDASARLVVAGNVHDPAYVHELEELVSKQPGVRTWFQYVPDPELQYFLNAADVCVLPYRDVTTSGAAILAFSFGRAIIAPALGGFVELAADGRGVAYDPNTHDGLLQAMGQARRQDMARAGDRGMSWAKGHGWPALAPKFAAMYAEVWKAGKRA